VRQKGTRQEPVPARTTFGKVVQNVEKLLADISPATAARVARLLRERKWHEAIKLTCRTGSSFKLGTATAAERERWETYRQRRGAAIFQLCRFASLHPVESGPGLFADLLDLQLAIGTTCPVEHGAGLKALAQVERSLKQNEVDDIFRTAILLVFPQVVDTLLEREVYPSGLAEGFKFTPPGQDGRALLERSLPRFEALRMRRALERERVHAHGCVATPSREAPGL
jgi:hypothetical protein